ncbi:acyl-CoA synthetase [Actinomadura vinacea]|uniref:Acyl-CoA synthetase n=1 Tax=Actinomadura vinacea TaxID=115336 RepID=A0ABN3J6X8_9ACTN
MEVEPVVRSGEVTRTHTEVRERAARIASGLAEAGVSQGDRIAVVMRNDISYLEVFAAVALLGAVAVPVNWHWRGGELEHLLRDSSARLVIVHTDLLPTVAAHLPDGVDLVEAAVPEAVAKAYGLAPHRLPPSGEHATLQSWIDQAQPWPHPPVPAPLGLIYTSGTTGLPKGILRRPTSPEQSRRLVELVFDAWRLRPGMRSMIPAPLYHTAPNTHAMLGLAGGLDLTVLPRFDAEETLRLIERHRIEHVQVVPTMLVRLLGLPAEIRRRYDLTSLKVILHAAAPCPAEIKDRIIDWFGPIVQEYYGGSETGPVVACDSDEWAAHRGTVGRPIADAGVRVLDGAGRPVPVGEVGEIFLRPPSAWPDFTYVGDDGKRRDIDRDGYLTIGDLGFVDADGFLHLRDRKNDMVISGGVNIYPLEIEQCISGLAGVADVAVFGIPDPEFGEALAAHVQPLPGAPLTEEDVTRHVRSRLAGYKVPRVVVLDDHLPREDSGKLFKRRLRERYLSGEAGEAGEARGAATARSRRVAAES